MFNFLLGEKVKCRITGFEGAILGRSDHITGCNQYYVQPPVGDDGKMRDGHWFDEDRLNATGEKLDYVRDDTRPPGADIPHNPRR